MNQTECDLSVVLPCRNQADHIADVLEQYLRALAELGKRCQLVVVPNACSDDTLEVVNAVAAGHPEVLIVENPQGGWGLSVRKGLGAATGELLCYTNSARTDPRTIGELLTFYERNVPCLAKVRRIKRKAVLREVGSWLYNLEARLLLGVGAKDVNGTPKIFSRQLYQKLKLESDGDLLDLELMAKVSKLGVPVVELPLPGFRRHGGRSTTRLRSAWKMYSGAWRLRRQLAAYQEIGL